MPANTLGRYEIIREIARSNDIVYEAIDPAIGRRIALKELQLPPNLVGSARRERIERFYREAKAAGTLTHPNIVTVFEVGEDCGRHFIAMEFLEGQTLQDAIEIRGALPPKEAVDIILQVLEALDFAHSKGVIHRDIKPANIQLLPGGRVKLTDFGIARIMHEPSITQSGQIFGTPSYMSPEQVAGREIDPRSDLFGVGVVLYEALTGSKPFTGDSVVTITYNIMNLQPARPAGVPEGLADIVMKAMAKEPSARYQSAREMADALKSDWQTAAPPPPPPIFFTPGQPPAVPPPTPAPAGTPPPGAGQSQPGTLPPYPYGGYGQARPRQPLITPGQAAAIRTMLLTLLLAGAVLAAVWGVNGAYQNYLRQQNDAEAARIIERAGTLMDQRRFSDAIEQYRKALQLELTPRVQQVVRSNIAAAYTQMGNDALNGGDVARAISWLREALTYDPDSGNALYLLGVCYARTGQLTEAVSFWEQAASRDPSSEGGKLAVQELQRLYIEQGLALERQGDLVSAIEMWSRVIRLDAGTPLAQQAQSYIDRAYLR